MPPTEGASSATMNPPTVPNARKRVISESEDPSYRNVRSRTGPSPPAPPRPARSPSLSLITRTFDYDRFTMPLRDSDGERTLSPHTRPLSTSSSITRAGTPSVNGDVGGFLAPSSSRLMRSASFSSFHSQAPEASKQPYFPEGSSKYILRYARVGVDFSLPPGEDAMPLACSAQNVLYFSRGNRVQYRNMVAADSVSQLCKLQDKHGDLKLLEAGPGVLAVATSKGIVQVWDTESKKMICSWTTKGVASMAWNGPVLSIGGVKGTIRHYDTRIQPTSKMKEQAAKVTRHQASVSVLSWNKDGKLLASGDENGVVYCWDARSKVPLDVGEFVQRRKKMQHNGAVSALGWCPWQPKLLATGDVGGTVKLWTIEPSNANSNASTPGKLDLGSKIVNLHFSPNYKELLSTLGPVLTAAEATPTHAWPRSIVNNSLAVHSFPSLRSITSLSISEQAVCGSVLNTGVAVHKIIVAVPGESKLKVFDVWGKRKEIKRQSSSLGTVIR
ncbi:WD40 repeat-like protein [Mycena crocata]|nr:WD40 repeat-like protein [Mycena crocata]